MQHGRKGDEMTDKNPAALRLAEDIATDAALEIRRLHEENETLKKCLFQMQNAAIELAKPDQDAVAVWELQEGGWDTIADADWMETLPIGTKLYALGQSK
jgi:hypothetical protein